MYSVGTPLIFIIDTFIFKHLYHYLDILKFIFVQSVNCKTIKYIYITIFTIGYTVLMKENNILLIFWTNYHN